MTTTQHQIENLEKIIEIVNTQKLARYKYEENGCRCIIGHMAVEAGVRIVELDAIVELFDPTSIRKMESHFGTTRIEMAGLQRLNDSELFTKHEEERKNQMVKLLRQKQRLLAANFIC